MNATDTQMKPQNAFPFDVTSRQPQQQLGSVKPTTAKPPVPEKTKQERDRPVPAGK